MMKDTPLSERILRRWKNRKYIAYFLVIAAAAAAIAGFTDSISKIFGLLPRSSVTTLLRS